MKLRQYLPTRPRRPPADCRRARAPRARPRRAAPPLPFRADRRIGLQGPHRLRIPAGGRHLGRAGLDGPLQDLNRRQGMKLLITGGGGFVGARLARTLLARGTLAGQPISRHGAGRPDRAAGGSAGRPAHQRARRARCSTSARRWPTRPSTASFTWPRRCRANARPISTSACAPTWTARARCSKRCARASSATVRWRAWCSPARWRCSARTLRCRCRRWWPTTRCRRRRPATACKSWCAST